MHNTVTMKDIAEAAGVSVMTVSRAFKDDSSVKKKTRDLIRETAEQMGYVFDSTAANLRTQRTNFVAVTIPSINNANFADTVDSLSKKLSTIGRQVLLGYSSYNIYEEEQLLEQLLRRRPEAVVVTGGTHTERGRRLLKNSGIPVIEMWDDPEDPIDYVVGFSNGACMEQLVTHFVDCGLTKIAFLGGEADGDTRGADRRRGFIRAMQTRGLDATRLMDSGQPPISMREGADAMATLLQDHPDTQGVICVSDPAAFGALTECARQGVSVPGDVAIAGFGAYEIASICVPTLTSIDPLPRKIGELTGDLLVELLEGGEDAETRTRILIEPALRVGGSSK